MTKAADGQQAAVPYTIHWGAAVGDISENSRYVKKAEGLLFQDGKVQPPDAEGLRVAADL